RAQAPELTARGKEYEQDEEVRRVARPDHAGYRIRARQVLRHGVHECEDAHGDDDQERAAQCRRYARNQASGRMCGNRMTSRIDALSVSSMTSRSSPKPPPAVGGMPCSSARM